MFENWDQHLIVFLATALAQRKKAPLSLQMEGELIISMHRSYWHFLSLSRISVAACDIDFKLPPFIKSSKPESKRKNRQQLLSLKQNEFPIGNLIKVYLCDPHWLVESC